MGSEINAYQKAAARAYGEGDYAFVAEAGKNWVQAYEGGDTLFQFVMIELSDGEGCDSVEEAIRRMESAQVEIEQVIDALRYLEEK